MYANSDLGFPVSKEQEGSSAREFGAREFGRVQKKFRGERSAYSWNKARTAPPKSPKLSMLSHGCKV